MMKSLIVTVLLFIGLLMIHVSTYAQEADFKGEQKRIEEAIKIYEEEKERTKGEEKRTKDEEERVVELQETLKKIKQSEDEYDLDMRINLLRFSHVDSVCIRGHVFVYALASGSVGGTTISLIQAYEQGVGKQQPMTCDSLER